VRAQNIGLLLYLHVVCGLVVFLRGTLLELEVPLNALGEGCVFNGLRELRQDIKPTKKRAYRIGVEEHKIKHYTKARERTYLLTYTTDKKKKWPKKVQHPAASTLAK